MVNEEREGRNARDGYRCRDGSVWYIGSPRELPTPVQNPNNQVYFNRLQAWGLSLFQSGYVSSEALGLITTVSADDWLWHSLLVSLGSKLTAGLSRVTNFLEMATSTLEAQVE